MWLCSTRQSYLGSSITLAYRNEPQHAALSLEIIINKSAPEEVLAEKTLLFPSSRLEKTLTKRISMIQEPKEVVLFTRRYIHAFLASSKTRRKRGQTIVTPFNQARREVSGYCLKKRFARGWKLIRQKGKSKSAKSNKKEEMTSTTPLVPRKMCRKKN